MATVLTVAGIAGVAAGGWLWAGLWLALIIAGAGAIALGLALLLTGPEPVEAPAEPKYKMPRNLPGYSGPQP